jgi:hypothetical protein
MAYQGKPREKSPSLWHSTLVKDGPKLVTIKAAPKWVKNDTLCVVTLDVNGVEHAYFTNSEEIAQAFAPWVGQKVVLIAGGNDKQGTGTMEIQPAGTPASQIPQPQPRQAAPQESQHQATQPPVVHHHVDQRQAGQSDIAAKKHLCQAANLMRLAVKKANDIASELGLPPEHRQGIATTLFLQSKEFVASMPVSPYTVESLGYGASSAKKAAPAPAPAPEPEPEPDDEPLPF